MAVELKCVEEGHTDKKWVLDVAGSVAVLKTLNGDVLAQFAPQDAQQRFKLPGLAEGTRHFAIALDEQTIRFAVDVMGLQQIEKFLARSVARPAHVMVSRPANGLSAPLPPAPRPLTLHSHVMHVDNAELEAARTGGAVAKIRRVFRALVGFVCGLAALAGVGYAFMLFRGANEAQLAAARIAVGYVGGSLLILLLALISISCLRGALGKRTEDAPG
jgi:hypothetical protein